MKDLFTAQPDVNLDTWAGWVQLLAWFAGLIATFAITWWASRRTVLALAYRLPDRIIEGVLIAAGGLAAAAALLTMSPMPVGFTLIAATLALVLAAAGVGFSLVGYDHTTELNNIEPIATVAKIVDLRRPDDDSHGLAQ